MSVFLPLCTLLLLHSLRSDKNLLHFDNKVFSSNEKSPCNKASVSQILKISINQGGFLLVNDVTN